MDILSPQTSVLLVIDVQGRLASLIFQKEEVQKNISGMIKGARILQFPILWTEQAPDKIGPTIPDIAGLLSDLKPIKKTSFSCLKNDEFNLGLKKLNRKQVIIVGIETHVCVYQTAKDLLGEGYSVYVVADAVSSRLEQNKNIGLQRIQTLGGNIVGTEMILCEFLGRAEGPTFKEILTLIK